MELFLAKLYTYIYDSLYTQTGIYENLIMYSDAITKALEPGGLLHNFFLVVRTISFGVLMIYFIISLGTKLTGKETSPSIVFKLSLEFFIGFAFSWYAFDIVNSLFQIGDWLASMIIDNTITDGKTIGEFLETFKASLSGLGFTAQVMYIFKALIPYIGCLICSLFVTYTVVTRVLRICVNATMSPIAISNMFDGSKRSDGVRFIKRTASMCLQCAVIMIISATVGNMISFMSADDSIFSSGINAKNEIVEAQEKMIESESNNNDAIASDVWYAVDKMGRKAYDYLMVYKPEVDEAAQNLAYKCDKVTEEKESDYKKYENTINLEIFERDSHNGYVYDEDGYAKLKPEYLKFNTEDMMNFMDIMVGGENALILLMMLLVKVGLIKKSGSICDTIVGI